MTTLPFHLPLRQRNTTPEEVMKHMYTSDLIKQISHETHLSERIIKEVLDAEREIIQHALKSGQEVRLPGFGTFYTRHRQVISL